MASEVRLVFDGAEMQRVLRSPEGPVGLYLIRKADEVIALAQKKVRDNPNRRGQAVLSGKLERTIVKRPYDGPEGFGMMVIAGIGLKPSYAYWVHEGNGPAGSMIFPKRASVLAWVTAGVRPSDAAGWRAARASGVAIIRPAVRASRPNPYLRDALREVITI